MRILYLCHRLPYPPDKGEKIRAYHFIRHLARRHEVHVACLIDDASDLPHRNALASACASVDAASRGRVARRTSEALALLTGRPLSVASFASRTLARAIDRRLSGGGIDVVVAQSAAMAEYVRGKVGVPRVMDFVDLDSEKWRTYAGIRPLPWSRLFELEAKRLARYEDDVAREFEHSVFVSRVEAALLERRVPDARISVIANGVDLEHFAPGATRTAEEKSDAVVFTGVMDYFPNVDAMVYYCETVHPRVRREQPTAEVWIVGRNPSREVARLARIPGVTVTGEVPDTRPWLNRAKLAIAPFRVARGVQNKVLEALAMALPVVGTSLAFQGIQALPGEGVEIADDAESFASAVVRLLRDDRAREAAGSLARAFAERSLPWQTGAAALEHLLEGLTGKGILA